MQLSLATIAEQVSQSVESALAESRFIFSGLFILVKVSGAVVYQQGDSVLG